MGQRSGVKVDLPYLVKDKDRHGNVRIYVRFRGKKTRIRHAEGSPEFLAVYNEAIGKTSTTGRNGTLSWLVKQYIKSAEFKGLDDKTRKIRQRRLEQVCESKVAGKNIKRGDGPFIGIKRKNIRTIRDEKSDTPGMANDYLKALRALFKWAVDADHLETNPCLTVPFLTPKRAGGFHRWTPEEVEKFEAKHPLGTMPRLALDLMLYTGARISDACRLGPQHESKGRLKFTEAKLHKKKRKDRDIPILEPLRRSIDATKSGQLAYVVGKRGRPYKVGSFGNWFRKQTAAAGIPHCAAHGLRKAGATLAAERGATAHQLKAIFGWASIKDAETYTREADAKRLANESMHLLVRNEAGP